MQKTFVKIISRKILTAAIVTGSAAFDASGENLSNNNMELVSSNIKSSVEFKGASEDAFLFDVKVENPDAEKFTLEIRDDNGKIVCSDNSSEINFVKEINLSNEELTAHYNFIVKTENNEPEHTFIVSITTKVAEEVEAA
jgi:hypothetical protein